MAKKLDIPVDGNIIKVPIEEAMPDNYLPYAVEVAKDRALPDVRDGLKPVHRRILYGSHMLKAYPDKPYYKSARIVGDILGKYHPHGDTSVYDAMVILAQGFTTRIPLIDGHGNWGSQDGDSPAAMRYTEARLTPMSMEMLRDIDKDVVDMVDNYSNSEKEPSVLPARYPNLLVNGAFGIAVGLATNIPPHNLIEVIDATLALIDDKDITTKDLMKYIKAPDLPTGGIIIGKNSLLSAYETGEGRVTLRSKASIEKLENGRFGIVITEFPYRRSKAKILQIISEMTADKRHSKVLEPISDIRDESDRTGIRAVIEFKKSADEETADKVLKYLYKKTDLQCNISFNMVALANGKPETMGLKTILTHYVAHQKEVITRRTTRELQMAEKRFHIVEGFIKAIDIMDQIIETIRASKSKKDAQINIVNKFGFTEVQAEAILELMLYRLTGLEIKVFEKEYKELEKEIKRLKRILENEKELFKVIKNELMEVKNKYGDDRRTEIVENDEEAKIDIGELIVEEDVMVTMSNEGFIKRIPLKSYNRSSTNVEDIEYREGDFNKYIFQTNTKDTVMFFTDKGNVYQLKAVNVPETKWKDKGEKVDTIIRGLDLNNEHIINVISVSDFAAQKDFLFFTASGIIKKTPLDKFITNYTKLMALKLKNDDSLIEVIMLDREREEKFLKVSTLKGLQFTIEEPKLEPVDRAILGSSLIDLPESDKIVNIEMTEEFEYKEFIIEINKNKLKLVKTIGKNSEISIKTNSTKTLLMFDNKGNVYKIPAIILQNLEDGVFELNELLGLEDGTKIISAISTYEFKEEKDLCFFTKKGLIRKIKLNEFEGNYFKSTAYKIKTAEDEVVKVIMSSEFEEALLITRRGMSIRFMLEGVNYMGKISSGVTAISLREEDEVIYAVTFAKDYDKALELKTNDKNTKLINIADIRLQNRAGRGNSLIMLSINEYLKEVK